MKQPCLRATIVSILMSTSIPSFASNIQAVASNDQRAAIQVGESLYDYSIVFYVDESGKHGLATTRRDEVKSTWEMAKLTCENRGRNWSLPSRTQLSILWSNRYAVAKDADNGSFKSSHYWSSTSRNVSYAWVHNFYKGNQDTFGKEFKLRVRCTRTF